tara:strand:+ start:560 stop:949 length:390 start_codon:yes stop_codon:yes gene_type:complete
MKKLLVTLFLIFFSSNTLAEWVLLQAGKESNEYIDSATIQSSGNLVKMWSLTNISKNIKNIRPGEKSFTIKAIHEYDCKEHKSRALFISWYNDYMGTGRIVRSSETPDAKWKNIKLGIRKSSWKIACRK